LTSKPGLNATRPSRRVASGRWLLGVLILAGGCGLAYRETTQSYNTATGNLGTMDVYQPVEAVPRPGVLLIHGGGWTSGDKGDLSEEAARLAASGYVVANTNYRLSPQVIYPVPIQDIWCALAYLRSHAAQLDLDPTRVALLGYSAGGYLAEMVGLEPADAPQDPACPNGTTFAPAAIIPGDAPSNLLDLPSLSDGEVADFVGVSKSDPEQYTADSPISHAGPGTPPFLLVHGTGDLFVDWHQSQDLRDAMVAEGDSVALLLIGGGGHVLNTGADFGTLDYIDDSIDTPVGWTGVLEFLQSKLGPPPE
jgi:acetyl esterase/lipase